MVSGEVSLKNVEGNCHAINKLLGLSSLELKSVFMDSMRVRVSLMHTKSKPITVMIDTMDIQLVEGRAATGAGRSAQRARGG